MDLKHFCYSFLILFLVSCSTNNAGTEQFNQNEVEKPINPKSLYVLHCESCHGLDGKKGLSGAKDLSISKLIDEEIKKVILYGNKKGMMPYKDLITNPKDIDNLVGYVKSLRQ
jgi:mono/diheme cytochrome c family protein